MTMISQRATGGRHRQGTDEPVRAAIPAPRRNDRRDDRPTVQLRRLLEPDAARRAEPRERGPAGGSESPDLDELLDDDMVDDDMVDERSVSDAPADDPRRIDEERSGEWDAEEWSDDADREDAEADDPDSRVVTDEPDRVAARRRAEPVDDADEPRPPAPVQPDVRRRRRAPRGRSAMRRAAWVIAAAVALAAVALVTVVAYPALTRDTTTEVPLSVAAPIPAEFEFGDRAERVDGWAVRIDAPRAVRASDDVDLPAAADRGLVFDVVLTNNGAEPRDSGAWTVKAIVGNSPVELLPTGAAPSRTIRSGASLTFPVTVGLPEELSNVQLEAAPTAGTPSLFVGTV